MSESPEPEYEDDFEDDDEALFSGDSLEEARVKLEKLIQDPDSDIHQIHRLASSPVLKDKLDYGSAELQSSPLELAVLAKRTDVVKLLLSQLYVKVDARYGLASTCLAQCCCTSSATEPVLLDICEVLLAHGADVNVQLDLKNPDSMNCLHSAIANEDEAVIKLLLENGADMFAEWQGMTPMSLAMDLSAHKLVNLLQDHELKLAEERKRDRAISTSHGSSDSMDLGLYDWVYTWDSLDIGDSLGSGGFGTVYKGKIKQSGDVVAVKKCLCQDSAMLSAFKKEVKLLASFRHEQIVLFRGACLELPNLCIITELMAGGNLYNLLHTSQPLPWKLRMRWSRDIARGMNYLHTLSPPVVHRDLKSLNILVNDYYMIKLCDFGMSRTKQHTVIQTKEKGGSPLWMAPECLRGDAFTEKSDVYSYGVVLWEILTRCVPWPDKEMAQLVGLVGFRNATLEIPSDIAPECPKEMISIMKQCWAADPEKRPTFTEIVGQLEDVVDGMDD
eukprot:TRINITY_DN67848_c7_g3_i1.p1 TRINITY_DN67848_c7_g3~~TRINITY_DN67848_c7_g3_i1.p1  ORF type:complete len:502 (-),score=3.39 TRINITY_DN67848_c7_g3_i1:477-1982(-)